MNLQIVARANFLRTNIGGASFVELDRRPRVCYRVIDGQIVKKISRTTQAGLSLID
jgi:hypothetical protein